MFKCGQKVNKKQIHCGYCVKVIQNCGKDHNCVGAKMLPSVINLGACLSNLLLNLEQKIIILLNYIKSFVYLHFFVS